MKLESLMLASENCDEEDNAKPKQRGYYGYEFIRQWWMGNQEHWLSTISTFEGPSAHTEECLAWILAFKKWVLRGLTQEGEGTNAWCMWWWVLIAVSLWACFIFNESTFRSTRPSWRPCEEDRIKSLEMSPYESLL